MEIDSTLCTQCLVRPTADDGWLTQIGDAEFGPYFSREMALRVAVSEALQQRRTGHPVYVAVADATGAIHAKRCLCPGFAR